jgi:sugar phosphate isomerase/epimerase
MAERMGERLRHIHLTDGTGSGKDEHLVPGRGVMGADRFLRRLAELGFAGQCRAGGEHPTLRESQ